MLYKYLLITIILFILELCYFKVAIHFKIADKPNKRSSHNKAVIRGGGIILAISSIIWFFVYGLLYPYFIIGLIIVALLSFLDDLSNAIKNETVEITVNGQKITISLLEKLNLEKAGQGDQ